jgi:putative Holliday junction resolvase
MRYMGIDYGSKRVGIAVSDETGNFALPLVVLKNSPELLDELNEIICDKNIEVIILGESKNYKGEDNKIMAEIREFKEKVENNLEKKVIYEPEFMTSQEAQHIQGKGEMHDASAAALILKSYLDRQ